MPPPHEQTQPDGRTRALTPRNTRNNTEKLERDERDRSIIASERTDKKGGKGTQTFRRVVSRDGKTMTVTIKGTNAQGQTVSNVVVFEKQ